MIPADKGISISFVTDLDLPAMGFAFENLIYDGWDEDQVNRNPVNVLAGFISMTITTLADPGLAPAGQHMVNLFAGLPLDAPLEPVDVQRYSEVVINIISRRIPELRNHLLLAEGYVPHTFGPMYGWKATPWQAGIGRPNLATPVKGLILAGQWTRPIQGVMPAILSGSEAARMILRAS